MTTFIVDWQQHKESATTELGENHFKFNPLNICTKDGMNFEMDARIIMEIDDDSIIVKLFGSVPVFVGNILSVLVRNFFTYKEVSEITTCRPKIQEQFSELAQAKLANYGVKIIAFIIVNTTMPSSFFASDKEPKTEKMKIRQVEDKGVGGNLILIFLGGVLLLTASLGISILADEKLTNVDYRSFVMFGIIIPILAVIIMHQHFEIKMLRRMFIK
jgi:hypothetical protein